MTTLAALVWLLTSSAAQAHGIGDTKIGATWTFDPWVVAVLYLSAVLYLLGTRRVWRRAGAGRGVRYRQAATFWTGWSCLALALISPLHWLGERLFTAHMIEHLILMTVAAPLIALARPYGAMMWGAPAVLRVHIGRVARLAAVAATWRLVRAPLSATFIQAAALWLWHMPPLYDLVLVSPGVHRLQHASFVLSALLFWWSLFHGPARARGYGVNVVCLFLTLLHSGVLGALLTVSRRLWFPAQTAFAGAWGLSPLEDQQLAGLVMWVPMGFLYTATALYFAAQWIGHASDDMERRHAVLAR